MTTDTLFTPYVTVVVDEGVVTGVEFDWADTLQNCWQNNDEGHNEIELWSSGDHGPEPDDAKTACAFLDREDVRKAIELAITGVLYGLK